MDQIVLIVPIASTLLIYWLRIRGAQNHSRHGEWEVRENLTLHLFIVVGRGG